MPDSGSGTYSLAEPGPINGQTGDATPITANLEDIEAALTARLMADGTKTATANQPMGGFKHTNVHDATARTDYAAAGQVLNGSLTYGGVAGGTADALTIAPSPAIAAYAIGQKFQFKVSASPNTTAATLNVNSVGAGAVTWPDGTALAAGDLPANAMVTVSVQALTPVFHLETQTRASLVGAAAFLAGRAAAGAAQALTALQASNVLLANASFGMKDINGWTYANNAGDATNDIDIAIGAGADSTGVYWIKTAALTKRLDAGWAVGTNQGGLDTGSIANADYYIWAIARSDTGVTDVLFSTSATAPTMPANYDYKRLIGFFRRTAGAILAFATYELSGGGLQYLWKTPINSVDLSGVLTNARSTNALSVPLAFSVMAHVRYFVADSTASYYLLICNPDEVDGTPGQTTPGAVAFTGLAGAGALYVRTSAAGLVASEVAFTSGSGPIDTFIIITHSFDWSRR